MNTDIVNQVDWEILKYAVGCVLFCSVKGCEISLDAKTSVLVSGKDARGMDCASVLCASCWDGYSQDLGIVDFPDLDVVDGRKLS